jgi:hypothetical protein
MRSKADLLVELEQKYFNAVNAVLREGSGYNESIGIALESITEQYKPLKCRVEERHEEETGSARAATEPKATAGRVGV